MPATVAVVGAEEWSAVAAIAAALAAVMSAVSILVQRRERRQAAQPRLFIAASYDVVYCDVWITNHGPGVATGIAFVAATNAEWVGGSGNPTASMLAPGEQVRISTKLGVRYTGDGSEARGDTKLVVVCQDQFDTVHIFDQDGVRRKRSDILKGARGEPLAEAAMKIAHPNIDLAQLKRVKGNVHRLQASVDRTKAS